MQLSDKEQINHNLNHRTADYETPVHSDRKEAGISDSSEKNFADRIVETVSSHYPKSEEEASVLMSRVWRLIEDEILTDSSSTIHDEIMKEKICAVSESFDAAVEKLRDLNMPLLRNGAITDYYGLA